MMKLTKRGRVVVGILCVMIIASGVSLWGKPPAVAPTEAVVAPEVIAEAKQHQKHDQKKSALVKYKNHKTQLTNLELVEVLRGVGFKGERLQEAWAISMRESNGRPTAYNGNRSTGDHSYGIFQINMIGDLGVQRRAKFNLESNDELFDPVTNAQIAFYMSKGGTDWSAWKGMTPRAKEWLAEFPNSKS